MAISLACRILGDAADRRGEKIADTLQSSVGNSCTGARQSKCRPNQLDLRKGVFHCSAVRRRAQSVAPVVARLARTEMPRRTFTCSAEHRRRSDRPAGPPLSPALPAGSGGASRSPFAGVFESFGEMWRITHCRNCNGYRLGPSRCPSSSSVPWKRHAPFVFSAVC